MGTLILGSPSSFVATSRRPGSCNNFNLACVLVSMLDVCHKTSSVRPNSASGPGSGYLINPIWYLARYACEDISQSHRTCSALQLLVVLCTISTILVATGVARDPYATAVRILHNTDCS